MSNASYRFNRIVCSLVVFAMIMSAGGFPLAAPRVQAQSQEPATSKVATTTAATPIAALNDSAAQFAIPSPQTEEYSHTLYLPLVARNAGPLTTTQQIVGPAGGRLVFADGQTVLEFPAGAVDDWYTVRYELHHLQSITDTDTGASAIEFNLEAWKTNESGQQQEVSSFLQPITLTVRLKGLIDLEHIPNDAYVYLYTLTPEGYQNPIWPLQVDRQAGTVSTQIEHFSGHGGGIAPGVPGVWKFQYTPPQADLYSGAATAQLPLQVPAGRNGLQPDLGLSYNSATLNGLKGAETGNSDWTRGGPLGGFWELTGIPKIAREKWDMCHWKDPSEHYQTCMKDEFTLILGGTGYYLSPAVAGQTYGRYYAEGAPGLYIYRKNWCLSHDTNDGECNTYDPNRDQSVPNTSKEYWIVRTTSGQEIRFGYNADAEQVTDGVCNPHWWGGELCRVIGENGDWMDNEYVMGYKGESQYPATSDDITPYKVPQAWWADKVADQFGNTMEFTYGTYTLNGGEHVTPRSIRYNGTPGNYLTHVEIAGNDTNPPDGEPTIDRMEMWTKDNGGVDTLVRQYVFGRTRYSRNKWCGDVDKYKTSEFEPLTSVQEYGGSGQALPIQTFGYEWRASNGNYDLMHLTSVNNGYGGITTFTLGGFGGPGCGPLGCSSYTVQNRTVSAGSGTPPMYTTYDYGEGCLSWTEACVPREVAMCGVRCVIAGRVKLVGFSDATETQWDGATPLARTKHYFRNSNPYHLKGREYKVEQLDPANNNAVLTSQETTWRDNWNGAWYAFVAENASSQYSGNNATYSRASYAYDGYNNQTAKYEYGAEVPMTNAGFENGNTGWTIWGLSVPPSGSTTADKLAGQSSLALTGSADGAAYQNVTGLTPGTLYTIRVWVKGSADNTSVFKLYTSDGTMGNYKGSAFVVPTSAWTMLSLDYPANSTGVASIELHHFAGGAGTIYVDEVALAHASDVGDERSTHWLYYPNSDPNVWIVNKPARESVYEGLHSDDSNTTYLKSRTRYRYDNRCFTDSPLKGQLTALDQWKGTGGTATACDAGTGFLTAGYVYDQWGNSTVVTDTRGNSTSTAYDGLYHLYPVQVTNAKDQTARMTYDVVKGVPTAVTDPNGAVTRYEYDSFGRLLKIAKPNDTLAAPTITYGYGTAAPFLQPLMIETSYKDLARENMRQFYDGLGRLIQTQQRRSQISGQAASRDVLVSYGYDALGRQATQTVPYDTPAYNGNGVTTPYQPYTTGTRPETRTTYDALGRATRVTAPDGTSSASLYGLLNQTSEDANRHIKTSFSDAFGRLTAVDETLSKWSDNFDAADGLAGWTKAGTATETGGVAHITGTGSWSTDYIQHSGNLHDSEGVLFSFKVDSTSVSAQLLLDTSAWGQASYRQWSLMISGGMISRYTWEGVSTSNLVPLMAVRANVWYRGLLKIGANGDFIAEVWERDNPAVHAQQRETKASGWTGVSWNYTAKSNTGGLDVDNYDELTFNTTRYTYDSLNNLTDVTDAAQNLTHMDYDALSRKTDMTDPDMGYWQYTYDNAGNLKTQTDAKNQAITFNYDELNRLTSKSTGVTYGYDVDPNKAAHITAVKSMETTSDMGVWDGNTTLSLSADHVEGTYAVRADTGSPSGGFGNYGAGSTFSSAYRWWHVRVKPLTPGSWTRFWFWDATDNRWEAIRSLDGDINFEVGEDLQLNQWNELWLDTWAPTNAGDPVETPQNGTLNASPNSAFIWDDLYAATPEVRYHVGRRTSMTDTSGVTTWTYDIRGRVVAETHTLTATLGTYSFNYTYNDADQAVTVTYPDGETVTTGYNNRGLPTTLSTSLGGGYVTGATYDAPGRLTQTGWSNGLRTDYAYYPFTQQGGRLRTITVGNNLLKMGYTYDPVGNVKTIADQSASIVSQTLAFGYDPLDRLTSATSGGGNVPGYDQGYAYDAIGRFINRVENPSTTPIVSTYAYTSTHLHAPTNMGGNRYDYDANGNMTLRVEISGTRTITYTQAWNAENKLERVTWLENSQPCTTTFVYDGDGNRALKIEQRGLSELTTIYVGGVYEKQIDTTLQNPVAFIEDGREATAAVGTGLVPVQGATTRVRPYDGMIAAISNDPPPARRGSRPPGLAAPAYRSGATLGASSTISLTNSPAITTSMAPASAYTSTRLRAPIDMGGSRVLKIEPRGLSDLTTLASRNSRPAGLAAPAYQVGAPLSTSLAVSLTNSPLMLDAIYNFTDNFNSLDPNIWGIWAWPDINFVATGGLARATRGSTYSTAWGQDATLWSKQFVNFTGVGAAVEWRMAIHQGATWEQMEASLVEEHGIRPTLTVECSTGDNPAGTNLDYICFPTMRDSTQFEPRYWSGSFGMSFNYDTFYTFQIVNPALRQVDFYVDGDLRTSQTFSVAGWRDIDWVQPVWHTQGWPATGEVHPNPDGDPNVLDASLDYVSIINSVDNGSLFIGIGGQAPNVWHTGAQPVTYTGADSGSGVRCVLAQWNNSTPPAFPPCYATSGSTVTPVGTNTLYVFAWDWAGNRSSVSDTYLRDDTPPTLNSPLVPGWTNGNVPVSVSASDSQSGVAHVYCRLEGEGWTDGGSASCLRTPTVNTTLYYYAVDNATNQSGIGTYTVSNIDQLPPNVPLASASTITWTKNDVVVTVSDNGDADATALYGASGVDYVTCSINDLGYSTTNCIPTFNANGHMDFYAVDNAGNQSITGTYAVTNINNLAPVLTLLSPVEGAVLTNARPVFRALITQTLSGLKAYQLYLDRTLVTPTLTGNTLTYAPALALADGLHGYTLDAQDNAGNEASLTVQFAVDTRTWVSITAPLNGSVFNQGVIPHVAIQTEDTPGTALTLTVNGTLYTHVLTATGGLWLLNDVPLAGGANTLTAFVRDPAGNTATHTIGVTQDASRDVAQARADHSPANPTLQALPFYLTAQAGVGRAVEQWTFRIWSALTPTVMITSGALPVTDTVRLWNGRDLIGQPAADGTYNYQLVLTTTGGLATASPVGTAQVSRAAPDAPVIACPANPWFSRSPLYLAGAAPGGVRVVVYQNNARVNVVEPSGGAWQSRLLFTGQPPYTTTVTARSEDAALNLSAPSAPCVVGLSATDPFTLPHASISTGALGLNRAATLNATTRATGASVAWVRAYTPPNDTLLELAPVFTNGVTQTYAANWRAPGSGVFQGIAALDFRAEDSATPAVRGEQFVQFWLDLVPPFIELTWPESGYAQANSTLTFLGRAEISSTVAITATSGSTLRTAVVNVDDFNRWQVTLILPDGVWTITARATDRAGNVGPAASLNSIVIDTTPPTITSLNVSAQAAAGFSVSWSGQDALSGLAYYTAQYRDGNGPWVNWLTGTLQTQAVFNGQGGHFYTFHVRAADRAGNVSAWRESEQATLPAITKYYVFGGQRVAMRQNGVVSYLHGDHLGSASLVTNQTGGVVSEARYKPYGETRWTNAANPTDYRFTGQRSEEATLGSLYDYGARFYSPVLGRFISADTVVPSAENPQNFNRYSYVHNNPLRYTDPSGHLTNDEIDKWAGYTAEWLKNNQSLIYQFLLELHFGDILNWTGDDFISFSLGTAGLDNGRLAFKNGDIVGHNTSAGAGKFGVSDLIDMHEDPGSHLPVAGEWNTSVFGLQRFALTGELNPLRFQLGKMSDGTKWAAWGRSPAVTQQSYAEAGPNVGRTIVEGTVTLTFRSF